MTHEHDDEPTATDDVAPGLGLGLVAVYAAILGDIYARAAINWLRFRSDRWKVIARAGTARAKTGSGQRLN